MTSFPAIICLVLFCAPSFSFHSESFRARGCFSTLRVVWVLGFLFFFVFFCFFFCWGPIFFEQLVCSIQCCLFCQVFGAYPVFMFFYVFRPFVLKQCPSTRICSPCSLATSRRVASNSCYNMTTVTP